jgi:pantetheine-phosphate adenylyltransferase
MTRVLYPGSFDPMTKGHMNIVEQALGLFDEVVIAVMNNPAKKNVLFTPEERVDIIKGIYKDNPNVKVVLGSGATVDVAIDYGCKALVRGLRGLSDYDDEVQMQQVNKEISGCMVNTVCLFADKEYQFISSTMVKEVFGLGKDISRYVEPIVKEKMAIKNKKD